jgi:hypothetical protein
MKDNNEFINNQYIMQKSYNLNRSGSNLEISLANEFS